MPTLFASEGFKICVFRDHRPPHVHVFGGDGRSAKIALEDGRLIGGNIRAREYISEPCVGSSSTNERSGTDGAS
jgi:hypothetical protein